MEENTDQTVVKALFRSPIQNIRHAIESGKQSFQLPINDIQLMYVLFKCKI